MVTHECIEIDLVAAQLFIACIQTFKVAVPDDCVALAPCSKVHHRVADVADFHIENGSEV